MWHLGEFFKVNLRESECGSKRAERKRRQTTNEISLTRTTPGPFPILDTQSRNFLLSLRLLFDLTMSLLFLSSHSLYISPFPLRTDTPLPSIVMTGSSTAVEPKSDTSSTSTPEKALLLLPEFLAKTANPCHRKTLEGISVSTSM